MGTRRGGYWFGVALGIGTLMLFSLKGVFAKFAYRHGVDAVSMMGLRMGFSLPFFVAVALWSARREQAPLTRRDLGAVALLGFVGYYVASILDFLGLEFVTAGVERLLLFVYPTIVVLLSAVFLGKRVTPRDVVALAMTYAGVAFVVAGGAAGEQRNLLFGALLIFGSAIGYAAYLVFGSETIRRVGAIRFTVYAMIAASIPAVVQWIVLRPAEVLALPAPAYGWSFTLAMFSTVIPIFLQSYALKRMGANAFAMLGSLGPVTTILAGYAFLGETMTTTQWGGAALVVAGVMVVTLRR